MNNTVKKLVQAEIDLAKTQADNITNAAHTVVGNNQFVFFAAFDGTNNDRNNVPLSGAPLQTNVAQLYDQVIDGGDVSKRYYPGPGTQQSLMGSSLLAPQVTQEAINTANHAYTDFQTNQRGQPRILFPIKSKTKPCHVVHALS